MIRTLLVCAVLATSALTLSACGGSSSSSSGAANQKEADLFAIDQLERTWHKAATTKNLALWMTIWAPDATFTYAGKTYTGRAAIRKLLAGTSPMKPENHWISDTPAYKIRTTVNGDKGTLYFECHYVDLDTQKVVAVVGADNDVQRINGKWLITTAAAASPTLGP